MRKSGRLASAFAPSQTPCATVCPKTTPGTGGSGEGRRTKRTKRSRPKRFTFMGTRVGGVRSRGVRTGSQGGRFHDESRSGGKGRNAGEPDKKGYGSRHR